MTKDVLVTIEGTRLGTDEETIVVSVPGVYHFTNEKHFIQYEEKIVDSDIVSKNIMKISPTHIILTKKTSQVSQMEFDLKNVTQTMYPTIYGNLPFDIRTESIQLGETEDRIEIKLRYSLFTGDAHVSDNSILIIIAANL